MNSRYDVVVVGGGPAGASTAICCAELGLRVALLEKGAPNRHKPCGGVLPWVASDIIESIIGEAIPERVYSNPATLGLHYTPPSGKANSGEMRGYKIHNIHRDKFDQWLRDLAVDAQVDVMYNTRFILFEESRNLRVHADSAQGPLSLGTKYVVGADGVRSSVRGCLKRQAQTPFLLVGQETWPLTGDFRDFFYGLFREEISPVYAYAIPKDETLIIGLGVRPRESPNLDEALGRFRAWLSQEFSFKPDTRLEREVWAIPFGYFEPGQGNVVMVGDAAGLCNPLSGEGIRLGIESGEVASSAIAAAESGKSLIDTFNSEISGIADMIRGTYDFVRDLDDKGREQFVLEELSRGTMRT